MSNPFLVSLFEHKAWCNRSLIETLRAAPADVDRLQMAIVLLTLEHTGIVDQIFKARLTGGEHGFAEVAGNRRPTCTCEPPNCSVARPRRAPRWKIRATASARPRRPAWCWREAWHLAWAPTTR